MKYTNTQKIKNIETGIRILNVELKTLRIRNATCNLCESVEITKDIKLINIRIKNMEYRIDQLELNQW